MGRRAKKPCGKVGCPNLVEYPRVYCQVHQAYEDRLIAARNKRYDAARGNDKEYKFYKSKAWRQLRNYVMERDHHLCQLCLKEGNIVDATVVHHIVPVRDDWSLRLKENNLISICDECHNKIHKKYTPPTL